MGKQKTEQFVIIPVNVLNSPGLLSVDLHVYAILRSYRKEKSHDPVYPSRETIAIRVPCSVDTVDRSIKRLQEKNLVSKIKGGRGYSNRYQFQDINSSRTHAATHAAQIQEPDSTHAGNVAAPMRLQPESENQNQEPERPHQLFHGSDKAYIEDDGSITIVLRDSTERRTYSGYDEGSFRYGKLGGTEAKNAAIKRFYKPKGWAKVALLPTDGDAESPHLSTLPFDNLNQ